jgi:hypothetical protein
MPRSFPQYTTCAAPGDATSSGGSWLGWTFWSLVLGGLAGGAWWLAATILGAVTPWGCTLGIGFLALALAGLHQFLHWYYNNRLMCIATDQCVAGTLTGDPVAALDGDQKYDTLIAPFTPSEVQDLFALVIQENPAEFGNGPANFADPIALQNYVEAMSEDDRTRLYMRVVHEKMFTQAGRDYLKRFLVRNEAAMGTDAFNNSPDDTFGTTSPNPMFRISPEDSLAPYLHCELEGDRLKKWLTNVLIGFWTFFVAYTAACAICIYFTGQDWACGWVAAGAAFLLGLLAWLISHLVNDPDEGAADQTDVDFADPAFEGDTSSIRQGDTMLVFGDWIKDTEHDEYFELHPIKALYLICTTEAGDDWELVRDLTAYPKDRRGFPVELITADDMTKMCRLVTEAETRDPDDTKILTTSQALSMAGGLR